MPSARPLLIAGAGGFAREVAEAARVGDRWMPVGFFDDDRELHGSTVSGLPVLGPLAAIAEFLAADPAAGALVCIGNPQNWRARADVVHRLALPADRFASVVHPMASLAPSTVMGPGCAVLAGVVATADVSIGAHVAVMPGTVLTHDDRVGDFATFGAGSRVAGRVEIGTGAYIGSAACITSDLRVGEWAMLGMGSVLLSDLPAGEVWAGVPARRLRCLPVPGTLRREPVVA